MIKAIDQCLSNSKCLNDTFAHLRPLGALTRENEADSWGISILFSKSERSLIDICVVSNHKSPMKMSTSSFRKRISKIRQFDSHTRVAQVFTNCFAVTFDGFCVVSGED
jgi:hypothetical protein